MAPLPVHASLRLLVWNVQWQRAGTPRGAAIRAAIARHGPDLICLTEANVDLLDAAGRIASAADFDGPTRPGRRKVLLWSAHPWEAVDALGDAALPPGRFVRGRTATPLGRLDVVGVCIPWDGAHVRMGRRDARPWEVHRRFLDGLAPLLDGAPEGGARTLVLGDFNQTLPRTRAPLAVHGHLMASLGPRLTVPTAGPIPGSGHLSIDHVAHGSALRAVSIEAIPNGFGADGRICDHIGLVVTLGVAEPDSPLARV